MPGSMKDSVFIKRFEHCVSKLNRDIVEDVELRIIVLRDDYS